MFGRSRILLGYVDDVFSYDFEDNLEWYEPYQKLLPNKQSRLLRLWDELGIPHEERKQVFGTTLTIIGFEVDPKAMTVTMPPNSRADLVTVVRTFACVGHHHKLREFQSLAGWINWSFNAFPLLRPGLSVLYHKMAGKSSPHQTHLGECLIVPRTSLASRSYQTVRWYFT